MLLRSTTRLFSTYQNINEEYSKIGESLESYQENLAGSVGNHEEESLITVQVKIIRILYQEFCKIGESRPKAPSFTYLQLTNYKL
jgi:hypothetical protein